MIRLGGPVLGEAELRAIQAVLESGQLVQAAEVAAFETALGARLGAPTVAVSSGTAALHLALLALGVGADDIVVVPTFSWPATANVVAAVGAQAVFVDVDAHDYNLDPTQLEATLRRLAASADIRRRLKAVIVVHAFGAVGAIEDVQTVCARFEVPLIEDAACALGSTLNGLAPGSWGALGCFSFHPRKLVTTAEGGAVTCRDPEHLADLRARRNHGLDAAAGVADFVLPGLNYRMSEIHAALGRCQLERLDALLDRRRLQAAHYTRLLADSAIVPQRVRENCSHNVQSYVVALPTPHAAERDAAVAEMRARGFETTIGTWHIPMTRYFRDRYGYAPGDFPVTDQVFASTMTLPLTNGMSAEEQDATITTLRTVLRGLGVDA